MSIEALNWALGHMQRDDLESSTAFVLMILANRADPEGVCWPSVKYICARTKLADSTVRSACKRIKDLGLLEIEEQERVDGGKGTNRYKLCISTPPPPITGGTPPPSIGGAPRLQSAVPPPTTGDKTKGETPLTDVRGPARRSKKFPIPEGFAVSADVTKWALEHGLLASYVGQQFEAFCDDARANSRLHADWDAALKTWLRRQPNFDRSAPRPMRRGGGSATETITIDRRCIWPALDSHMRCETTSEQDKDGLQLPCRGGSFFICSKHSNDYWRREDERKRQPHQRQAGASA